MSGLTDPTDPTDPTAATDMTAATGPAAPAAPAEPTAVGGPTHPEYPVRTKRLRLRPVRRDDVEAIHAYRSMPDVALYLPHEPHTREVTRQTVDRLISGEALATPGDWLGLAVENESGRVVGEVFLRRETDEPDTGQIGFAFHPDVHGTGIATEAVTAGLDIAFDHFGWHRVIGICDVRNIASAALMRRVGMRHEAVLREGAFLKGAWCSDSVFAVLAAEWRRTPPPSAQERAIDRTVARFLAAFTRRAGEPADLDAARALLAADAVIECVRDGGVDLMGVDTFLTSRQALLDRPGLTEFQEFEVTFSTLVTAAGRATRGALSHTYGVRDGVPFAGWGRHHITLAADASGEWRIQALTRVDDPEPRS